MKTFFTKIYAADGPFFEGELESLIVPTIRGQRGFMANHSPVMSAIVAGKMTYRMPGGENTDVFVSEGMIKCENNEVLILVDSVIRPEDIDEMQAREEADRAKEILLQKKSLQEYKLAQAQLAREINKLKVKGRGTV